jgi:tetratricopeptide (TPR) repeat protein
MAFVARAQQPALGQLDASPTLFTVMAAINACGFDADLASPSNHPLRNAIRAELKKKDIPSLPALKEFFLSHKRRTDTGDLSQYISFALSSSGPPSFAVKMRDVEIPPDVSGMLELSGLLEAFYKEAGIEDLWRRSQPAIDQYIALYHTPVSDSVLAVNAYLRQQTSGFKGRHFQVFIELQAPPNQIQTRSYGDQYYVVIAPSPEPRTFDVRHAYLHYLLDPLSTRHQEIIARKKPLLDQARRSRALPEAFKDDFLLLVTESLIKAVEARLDHKPEMVQQALLQGYILTPYFSEALPVYEKQEQSMLLYYPDLVGGIDNFRENARLDKVTFSDAEAAGRVVRSETHEVEPALTGAAKTLDDAEKLYVNRDLAKAKKLFETSLKQTELKPQQAAGYYGLGRIALLQKDPENAEKLLLKARDSEPEPFVKGWVLVYLGKLSAAAGDRAAASKYLNDALHVEGASEKTREEATRALQLLKQ